MPHQQRHDDAVSYGRAVVIDRDITVLQMSREQFSALPAMLDLPPGWLGRFPDHGDHRDIHLSAANCGSAEALAAAVAYVRRLGLAYEVTVTVRHDPRGPSAGGLPRSTDPAPAPATVRESSR